MSQRPSGEQFEIRYGDQRAVLTEVGATIRDYTVGGRAVLDGFDSDQVCSGGRGQHLVPWPNRVRDGRYQHDGTTQQLALSEPANRNAIHGLVRWVPWRLIERSDSHLVLATTIHPQPGWPTTLSVTIRTELGDDGLAVTTTASNAGSRTAPYGTGAHPYLTLGAETVNDAVLQVPASTYLRPDDRGIPVDPRPVAGTAQDFRQPRAVGDLVLDTAYTDVERDPDGRWRVRLSDHDTSVVLWGDAGYSWLQLFTGDTLPPGRARAGLAVEPMTCGPDAFNTGAGLVVLEPGDSHQARWGITLRGITGR